MTRVDWLALGLRLLGVFFFVDGFGYALLAALTIPHALPQPADDWGASSLFWNEWSRILAYGLARLGGAAVLIFGTNFCVRIIAGRSAELRTRATALSGIQERPSWPHGDGSSGEETCRTG